MNPRIPHSEQALPPKPSRMRRLIREASVLGALVLVLLAARSSLADHVHVPTGSMRPTVDIGARLVIDKTAYGLRIPFSNTYVVQFDGPQTGDVVVLESPEDGQTLLKRVIAGPNDRVAVRQGRIILNGQVQPIRLSAGQYVEALGRREHLIRLSNLGGMDLPAKVVPPNSYLVMGDNRGESHDGRAFGFVSRETILGRAVAIYLDDDGLGWTRL